jgi:hypothetical protein
VPYVRTPYVGRTAPVQNDRILVVFSIWKKTPVPRRPASRRRTYHHRNLPELTTIDCTVLRTLDVPVHNGRILVIFSIILKKTPAGQPASRPRTHSARAIIGTSLNYSNKLLIVPYSVRWMYRYRTVVSWSYFQFGRRPPRRPASRRHTQHAPSSEPPHITTVTTNY